MEAKLMSRPAREEYLRRIYDRYHRMNRKGKERMLDEYVKVTGYHRKSALRLLSKPKPSGTKVPVRSRRRNNVRYGRRTMEIIESIWEAMDYPWSVRLVGALKEWMPHIRKRFRVNTKIERELLSISARQIDRRLKDKKRRIKRRFYGTTKPGYLLKSQIPIRVKSWDIRKPGYLEVDTVAHCGSSLQGDFLYTVNGTDIRTGWVERQAILGKGEEATSEALKDIRRRLPFPLRGIDSDNGGEFINHHLLDYCLIEHLEFTRSRPCESRDQAHVEQKNFTHVRKLLGWQRYSSPAAQKAINGLYRGPLRLLDNLFRPSVKLKSKKRIGSRMVRRYFPASSPLQRTIDCMGTRHPQLKELLKLREKLDPFELAEQVNQAMERIVELAERRPVLRANSEGLLAQRQKPFGNYFVSRKQKKKALLLRGLMRTKAA